MVQPLAEPKFMTTKPPSSLVIKAETEPTGDQETTSLRAAWHAPKKEETDVKELASETTVALAGRQHCIVTCSPEDSNPHDPSAVKSEDVKKEEEGRGSSASDALQQHGIKNEDQKKEEEEGTNDSSNSSEVDFDTVRTFAYSPSTSRPDSTGTARRGTRHS